LFPIFATGVIETSGKFAAGIGTGGNLTPVSLTPVANLPPVSTTPVVPVAKVANLPLVQLTQAANLPPVSLIPVMHIDLGISPQIFEKFQNDPNVISGAWEKMILEKT
jgi:hypothetical protein